MFCKKCGKELQLNSIFCTQCGQKNLNEVLHGSAMDPKNKSTRGISRLVMIIPVIIGIIVFISAYGIARYGTQEIISFIFGNSKNQDSQNSIYSQNSINPTEKLINETVKGLKKIILLPNQIDGITLLVDITAEPTAIRYHYVISDSDPSVDLSLLTIDSLKNNNIPSFCNDNETKNRFEKGINVELSYVISSTQQSYFVVITRDDCYPIINQTENTATTKELTLAERAMQQDTTPKAGTQIDNAVIKTAPAQTTPAPIAPTPVVPTPAEPNSTPEIIESSIVNAYESAVNSTIIQRNALISARFNSDKDYARNKEVFLTSAQKEAIYNDDYSAMQSELADVNTRMGYLSSIKCDIYYCPPMSYTASDLINAINDLSYELDRLTIVIRSQGY